MTWDEAQRGCQRVGMHLATITDAEEQGFLAQHYPAGISDLWIGASDRDRPGQEQWVTGEPMVSATRGWHDRECELRYLPLCEMEAH